MESPSNFVNATRQNDTLTANGAVTNSTSLNSVVDLFFIAGASRNMSNSEIETMLERSFVENSDLTLKLIFWAGDVRQGAGERRFFKTALKWLRLKDVEAFHRVIKYVAEYNRWDSLFEFKDDTAVLELVKQGLEAKNGLLGKWLPRKEQYNNFKQAICDYMKLSYKQYRKLIVELSKTVEQQMCSKQWDKIEYSHVPSVAMNKYRTAFYKHDEERMKKYIESVKKGESKINAGAIFPYDLYRKWEDATECSDDYSVETKNIINAINAQWSALPNYIENDMSFIPVCDVSGSMLGLPMDISISLGVYLSERNKSIFKDAFITFSGNPKMEYLQGDTCSRFKQLSRADWAQNTNLDAVFELILNAAVNNNLSDEDMPKNILIITDGEFDNMGNLSAKDMIKQKYNIAGYKIPNIIWWNVNGRQNNIPCSQNEKGMALISGASPSIFKGLLKGDLTPIKIVESILLSDRYKNIE